MSHFVQIRIKLWVRFLPIGCARNDRIHTGFFTQLSNFLRIITFISYKMPSSPYFFNDFSCNFTVVDLPPPVISKSIGFPCASAAICIFVVWDRPIARSSPRRAPLAHADEPVHNLCRWRPILYQFLLVDQKKLFHNPLNDQRLKRLYAVFHGQNPSRISLQGAPVPNFHKIASLTDLSFFHRWQPCFFIVICNWSQIESLIPWRLIDFPPLLRRVSQIFTCFLQFFQIEDTP